MIRLLRFLLLWTATILLSLRYRVRVEGLEQVRGSTRTLVLPNHPAYVDPPLVLSTLWWHLEPRPLLLGTMFRNPLLFWLPRLVGAVNLDSMNQASSQASRQAASAVDAVINGLREGRNQILWPAGRAQREGREALPATRSAVQILQQVKDANLVLIRTRGLWGSMFSYGRTGRAPRLTRCLLKGVGILAANLIFFTPRRQVHIAVQRIDRSHLPALTRDNLNRFLESWYNEPGLEEPAHVPYHSLFGSRQFEFPKPASSAAVQYKRISPGTRIAVRQMLVEKIGRDLSDEEGQPDITIEMLGLDSLERMELSLSVEQRFGFTSDQVPNTVGELEALAEGLVDRAPPEPPPKAWFRNAPRQDVAQILGNNIPEAFVRRALDSRRDVGAADDRSGAVTYERLLVGARIMANRFRQLDGRNVGLMLPASVAADTALCALHLAGKLPVLLNWTTGPAVLDQSAKVMGLRHVVTSRMFVDRLDLHVPGTEYLFLEDLRSSIGKWESIRQLLTVRFAGGSIRHGLPDVDPKAPAVVLFTSGSEKAPKAVPLSHRNILSNIQCVLDVYELSRENTLLGFLPTFHSFGLTMTCLLPLLGGIRVVHHPDPTDAASLTRKAKAYRVTIVCGTPTFIQNILDRSEPGDLESVHLVVVGAEKCPESVYDRLAAAAPQAHLLEGYGITECSPLISGNRREQARRGSVGPPLPGIEVMVVDSQTMDPVPVGETGMLLVCGPNVFSGYIGHDGPTPFHEHDGKRWYVTGDLVQLDEDGFIFFRGRLKRFLKAGGEMISLPAIEEPLAVRYPHAKEGPRVAVEGIETEGGRHIALFTTEKLQLQEANRILMDHGFRGVMRLDEVKQIEQIPVLGTGKTDYKVLRRMLEEGSAYPRPTYSE